MNMHSSYLSKFNSKSHFAEKSKDEKKKKDKKKEGEKDKKKDKSKAVDKSDKAAADSDKKEKKGAKKGEKKDAKKGEKEGKLVLPMQQNISNPKLMLKQQGSTEDSDSDKSKLFQSALNQKKIDNAKVNLLQQLYSSTSSDSEASDSASDE